MLDGLRFYTWDELIGGIDNGIKAFNRVEKCLA